MTQTARDKTDSFLAALTTLESLLARSVLADAEAFLEKPKTRTGWPNAEREPFPSDYAGEFAQYGMSPSAHASITQNRPPKFEARRFDHEGRRPRKVLYADRPEL